MEPLTPTPNSTAELVLAYHGSVSSFASASWWPDNALRQHPVDHVYVCGRQILPVLPGQMSNRPRLEIPLSGCYETQIQVSQGAVTVQLQPGSTLFAPPNSWNQPTWRHPVRLMSIVFGKKQLDISLMTGQGSAQPGPGLQKFCCPCPLTGPLPKVLAAMCEVAAASGPEAALPDLARALLCCVQQLVLQSPAPTAPPVRTLLENVCDYLQEHYAQDLSRESVAKEFGISPNYLSRVFQVQGNMTFSSYLTHVRTDRAKHLLRNRQLKLDEVAACCGYRDTAYFCRVFKRVARLTPAEFRAQYKAGASEMVFSQ